MTKVCFPARCAVAVVHRDHLVSQVYPASVPVEVFLDDLVELLDEDLRRRGADGLDPALAYQLHRTNGTRLDISKTLDELGVEDGATLVLEAADEGESFEPQYESLSTGLARVGRDHFAPVTAQTAVCAATAILIGGVLSLIMVACYLRIRHDTWTTAVAATVTGFVLLATALRSRRSGQDLDVLPDGLAWSAAALLSLGIATAAPGGIGAAHVFAGAVALGLSACGVAALTGRHLTFAATTVTVCAVGGLIAGARMWRTVPVQWLGMCLLIVLLLAITTAPNLALRAARIRPPHFGSITGRDLFRRGDDMATDTVTPVREDPEEDSGRDTTPNGAFIAQAARRANAVLTGLCVAVALMLPIAAWVTVMPGQPRGNAAAVLVLLFVLIFVSRGRAFADRKQAVAVVLGGCAAFFAGVIRYVLAGEDQPGRALLWGTLVLGGFAAAAVAAALVVPGSRFTPLVRMATEWVELTAIVAALPLAAWIGGLFTWVRMR